MYLAVVMDLFARKPIGWAMSFSPDSQLTEKALSMAFETGKYFVRGFSSKMSVTEECLTACLFTALSGLFSGQMTNNL
ncbi:TPA: hypothetical protein QHL53_002599 [Proteus mirabilis]|nr:hypothetical protein [Proteus mirabilis]